MVASKDNMMVKYDKRRLDEPLSTFQHDDFFCQKMRMRISLSNNERYAALCSNMNRIVIFDLLFDENVKVLEEFGAGNLQDLQW